MAVTPGFFPSIIPDTATLIDQWASKAASNIMKQVDKKILAVFVQEYPEVAEIVFDPMFEEDEDTEEWDGQVPDPYARLDAEFDAGFIAFYGMALNGLLITITEQQGDYYDMRFQMQCDDCSHQSAEIKFPVGPCNVSNGFADKPCHMGSQKRKDGWYLGRF